MSFDPNSIARPQSQNQNQGQNGAAHLQSVLQQMQAQSHMGGGAGGGITMQQMQMAHFLQAQQQQQQQQQQNMMNAGFGGGQGQGGMQGMAGLGQMNPMGNMGGGGGPAAMLASMQQQQQQAQQQGGGMVASAPPNPPQVNLQALAELVRSGQITPEQFGTLAGSLGLSNPQNNPNNPNNLNNNRPPPQMQNPNQQPPPQLSQLTQLPQLPQLPPQIAPSQPDRIPYAVLQPHFQSLSLARNLQTKLATLERAMKTGMAGGDGGQVLRDDQRNQLGREIEDTRRILQQIVQQITGFQAQYGQPKILADWNYYTIANTLAHNGGNPQQNPNANQNNNNPNNNQPQQPPPPNSRPVPQPQPQPPQQRTGSGTPALQSAVLQQQILAAQARKAQASAQVPGMGFGGPVSGMLGLTMTPNMAPTIANGGIPSSSAPPPLSMAPPTMAPPTMNPAQQPNQPPAGAPPLHLLQTHLEPSVFMKSLFDVMRKRGEPITGTPFIEGREVDLYNLYQAVMLNGGSQRINATESWDLIVKALNWDQGSSSKQVDTLARELAKTYQQLLRPFEEVWAKSLLKQQQNLLERVTGAAGGSAGGVGGPGAPNGNFTSQQLLAHGFSASQVEFLKSQPQPNQNLSQPPPQLPQQPPQQSQQPQVQPNQPVPDPQKPNLPATSSLKASTFDPSMEQMSEARSIVSQLRNSMEVSRPKLKFLHISEEEKARVAALTHELVPVVKKVGEILPLFLAMSNDTASVQKILTMAALFSDQIKYIASGQFALSMAGLEQLRDQFQRCWGFVKHNHKNPNALINPNLARPASSEPPPPPGPTTLLPSTVQKEQFGLMAQKNAALRVEDLKPPPVKHRRTASSSVAPSPSHPSPQTPRDLVQTPQNIVQTPQNTAEYPMESPKVIQGKAAGRKGKLIADSNGAVATASPKLQEDEVLSLKRKREMDEAEQDPDGFITKTLKTFSSDNSSSTNFLAKDITSHLPFDFDPIIPMPVNNQQSASTLSFSTLPFSISGLPPVPVPVPSTSSQPAFDFDFFIDSTAAGLYEEAETPVETPELVKSGAKDEEASPPSDEENDNMIMKTLLMGGGSGVSSPKKATSSNPFYTPALHGGGSDYMDGLSGDLPSDGLGGFGFEDEESKNWSRSFGLPDSFAWEGELPKGSWEIYAGES